MFVMGSALKLIIFIGISSLSIDRVRAQDWKTESKQSADKLSKKVEEFAEKVLGVNDLQGHYDTLDTTTRTTTVATPSTAGAGFIACVQLGVIILLFIIAACCWWALGTPKSGRTAGSTLKTTTTRASAPPIHMAPYARDVKTTTTKASAPPIHRTPCTLSNNYGGYDGGGCYDGHRGGFGGGYVCDGGNPGGSWDVGGCSSGGGFGGGDGGGCSGGGGFGGGGGCGGGDGGGCGDGDGGGCGDGGE